MLLMRRVCADSVAVVFVQLGQPTLLYESSPPCLATQSLGAPPPSSYRAAGADIAKEDYDVAVGQQQR